MKDGRTGKISKHHYWTDRQQKGLIQTNRERTHTNAQTVKEADRQNSLEEIETRKSGVGGLVGGCSITLYS